jgi:hypothetical protein
MSGEWVRLSEVFLFGTERIKREWEHDRAIETCMHTHINGQYMDEPTMNEDEAEELLKTGIFPDKVWERMGGK